MKNCFINKGDFFILVIQNFWKGAGVAELARLESVCTCKRTVGSNPTLSALKGSLLGFPFFISGLTITSVEASF